MISGSSCGGLYPMEKGLSLHAIKSELSREVKRYEENIKLMHSSGLINSDVNPISAKQQEIYLLFKKSMTWLNPVNKAIHDFNKKEALRSLNDEIDILLQFV